MFDSCIQLSLQKPKKDIKIEGLTRMADSTIWGEAIARAIGYKENEFLNALRNNIKFQNADH